jgi:hypothetical protein
MAAAPWRAAAATRLPLPAPSAAALQAPRRRRCVAASASAGASSDEPPRPAAAPFPIGNLNRIQLSKARGGRECMPQSQRMPPSRRTLGAISAADCQ